MSNAGEEPVVRFRAEDLNGMPGGDGSIAEGKRQRAEFKANRRLTYEIDHSGRSDRKIVTFLLDGIRVHVERFDACDSRSAKLAMRGLQNRLDGMLDPSDIINLRNSLIDNWEGGGSAKSFTGISIEDLAKESKKQVDWIVKDVFSSGQPTMIGAAPKVGKTTQLVDLCVSLTTGEKWLDTFDIPRRRKVLFITGESNYRGIGRRLDRALRAKGLTWEDLDDYLMVEAIEFPSLPSKADREILQKNIAENGIEVVIIDPLYRGLMGVDTSQLNDAGAVIIDFVKACQPADVILSHHFTKSASKVNHEPKIEDLTGSGGGETCGNWWLVTRNEPYSFDGMHDWLVVYGGRDEQYGRKRILFNEKDWAFDTGSAADIEADRARKKDEEKEAKEVEDSRFARAQVENFLKNRVVFVPRTWVSESVPGVTKSHAKEAIKVLLRREVIIEGRYRDDNGGRRSGGIGFEISAIPCPENDDTPAIPRTPK